MVTEPERSLKRLSLPLKALRNIAMMSQNPSRGTSLTGQIILTSEDTE